MLRKRPYLSFFALSLGFLNAQPAPPIDHKLLFHYVKYLERWPADSELKVSESKPSAVMPGLFEVQVDRTRMGRVVSQRRYFVSADGKHFLKGDAFEIGETPFEKRIATLARTKSPSIGPENAPVTISVFEDFQCPDCADASNLLSKQLPEEFGKQVRIVFHDFPLVQHKWAMPAAIAGRCAFRSGNEKFWDYYRWVFAHQRELNETNFAGKVGEWAKSAKLGDEFGTCVGNRETESEVAAGLADATSLEVQGTPTLFLNGRMLPTLFPNGLMVPAETQFSALKWLIQFELHVIPPAEACCTISLP
jgi:protein-disulfide isomerase